MREEELVSFVVLLVLSAIIVGVVFLLEAGLLEEDLQLVVPEPEGVDESK